MNTSDTIREESRKDPDALKREADAARANVGETLSALETKLSPGQLLDQTMGFVQRHGGELARNLGTTVKQNPIPLVLTGIGIAWLIASNRSSERMESGVFHEAFDTSSDETSPGMGEKLREGAASVQERVGAAREKVADAASRVSTRAHEARDRARAQAARARQGFSQMMDEQPLVLGVLAVALGAAIGASLPATRKEDELMGEARDQAFERVAEAGAEQLDKAREATGTQTHGERS